MWPCSASCCSASPPPLPEAQEGVPVEIITENQLSELTKGERQADKPMPNDAQSRADKQAEKIEEREPENPRPTPHGAEAHGRYEAPPTRTREAPARPSRT